MHSKRPIASLFDLLRVILFFGEPMIKCHLSRLMGEKKLKIVDVARETGVNRGTVTRLYHETASRVELETIEALCRYLGCDVGDLFEFKDD
ncbi:helix-turn-helix domain-containing protein [Hydrocarboniclastica marina]